MIWQNLWQADDRYPVLPYGVALDVLGHSVDPTYQQIAQEFVALVLVEQGKARRTQTPEERGIETTRCVASALRATGVVERGHRMRIPDILMTQDVIAELTDTWSTRLVDADTMPAVMFRIIFHHIVPAIECTTDEQEREACRGILDGFLDGLRTRYLHTDHMNDLRPLLSPDARPMLTIKDGDTWRLVARVNNDNAPRYIAVAGSRP